VERKRLRCFFSREKESIVLSIILLLYLMTKCTVQYNNYRDKCAHRTGPCWSSTLCCNQVKILYEQFVSTQFVDVDLGCMLKKWFPPNGSIPNFIESQAAAL
jgi:hypothetical protein